MIQLAALTYLFVGGAVRYQRTKSIDFPEDKIYTWFRKHGVGAWGVVIPAVSAIAGLWASSVDSNILAVKAMIGFGVFGIFSLLEMASATLYQSASLVVAYAKNDARYEHWSFDLSLAGTALILAFLYVVSTSFGCCCMDCCDNTQAATTSYLVVEQPVGATDQAVSVQKGGNLVPIVFSRSSPPKYQHF